VTDAAAVHTHESLLEIGCTAATQPNHLRTYKRSRRAYRTARTPQQPFTHVAVGDDPFTVVVAYSDGVTEARNVDGDEFGEERLLACARTNCSLVPADLLDCISMPLTSSAQEHRNLMI
jgi:stage II sporulation SpoE-like protein